MACLKLKIAEVKKAVIFATIFTIILLQIVRDKYCIHVVSYTVVLEDTSDNDRTVIVEQVDVSPESCVNGFCTTSFFPSISKRILWGSY